MEDQRVFDVDIYADKNSSFYNKIGKFCLNVKIFLLAKLFYLVLLVCVESMNSICRKSAVYPVFRYFVPDDRVSWNVPWPEYSPPFFSASHLKQSSWADPDIDDKNFQPKWNAVDERIDRRSYEKSHTIKYDVVDGYPLNPKGRTGLCGRGRLGRWGPNHAADAVVTRWKKSADMSTVLNPATGWPVLQFIAILRKDCRKWAIPGGFVNADEESSSATLRELFEEAINLEKLSDSDRILLQKFFSRGKEVYKGYVDDPRNTDNAWIETTASNFHDSSGEDTVNFALDARDDAADVKWIDILDDMDIYETHHDIIKSVNELHLESSAK